MGTSPLRLVMLRASEQERASVWQPQGLSCRPLFFVSALADAGVGRERNVRLPGVAPSTGTGTRACDAMPVCPRATAFLRGAVSELAAGAASVQRECLRRVADAGSVLLRRCGGRVDGLVAAVGSQVFAPHVDTQSVKQHFGVIKVSPHPTNTACVVSGRAGRRGRRR